MHFSHKDVSSVIKERLAVALLPTLVEIEDDSAKHAGHHKKDPDGPKAHFRVRIESSVFAGKSKIDQHRLVYDVLADLLKTTIHALELETRVPRQKLP